MIQEYLFTDLTQYEKIEKYQPDKVKTELNKIDNSACFIATYSVTGENEDSAKLLSQIDEYILEQFKPTVLTNESSAYFNKKLFPYINEFERKLRKLLYLKSALNKSDKSFDNIKDLETKDLGEIFELLFTDEDFVKDTKIAINNKTWRYTKREVLSKIEELSEDTIWKKLMDENSIALLEKKFFDVKNYRNDVMHAHNINSKTFAEAKSLFKEINNQLDAEIGKIITTVEEKPEETIDSDFNIVLSDALKSMSTDTILESTKALLANEDLYKELKGKQMNLLGPGLFEVIKLKKEIDEIKGYHTILDEIKKTFQSIPQDSIKGHQELLNQVKKTLNPISQNTSKDPLSQVEDMKKPIVNNELTKEKDDK